MTILSGIKLKLYPNKTQKQTIEQTFGNSRFVWNQFKNMQENRYNAMINEYNSYKEQAKENGDKIINPIYIGDYDMQKLLTELKKENSWLHFSDATVLQKTLSNLDRAYKNFLKSLINLKNQNSNHVNIVVSHLLVEQINENQEKQVSMLQALVMFMYQN